MKENKMVKVKVEKEDAYATPPPFCFSSHMTTVDDPILWTLIARYFLESDFWDNSYSVEDHEVKTYWICWYKVHELFTLNVNGCSKMRKLEEMLVRHALIHMQCLYDRHLDVAYDVFLHEFRLMMKEILVNRLTFFEQEPYLSIRSIPWAGLFGTVKEVLDCDTPSKEDYEDWIQFCEELLFDFVQKLHVDMEDLAQLILYGCAKTDTQSQWNMDPPLTLYMKCLSVNVERGHYRDPQWSQVFKNKLNGLLGIYEYPMKI